MLRDLVTRARVRINALRDRKTRLLQNYKKELEKKEVEKIKKDIFEQ